VVVFPTGTYFILLLPFISSLNEKFSPFSSNSGVKLRNEDSRFFIEKPFSLELERFEEDKTGYNS